jgi:alkylation response protein AidB-like acyl-CoA dehydrogenase
MQERKLFGRGVERLIRCTTYGMIEGDCMTEATLESTTQGIEADERRMLLDMVRGFGKEFVEPRVAEYDRDEKLPLDLLEQTAKLGIFGGTIPEEWDGAGMDHVSFAEVLIELSRSDHALACLVSMPSALVGGGLLEFGSDEQRERWLKPLARGEIFGGAGVTEPRSGTDVAGMETTYRRDGDGFVIKGVKTWISNLDIASFFVTFATHDRSLKHRGISAFVIPADTPGLSVHPIPNKLGFRPLSSGELVLDDVYVGSEALIGEEGQGFSVAMQQVERGRLGVAARAVGMAKMCLDDSIAYAQQRVVFDQPISEYQLTQRKIAMMSTEIEAARALTLRCAEALERGERGRVEASMAKMYATDVLQRVSTEAVQIHGAYGASDEYRVGRAYRDAKVFQIVEGTNDLHQLLIAQYAFGTRK